MQIICKLFVATLTRLLRTVQLLFNPCSKIFECGLCPPVTVGEEGKSNDWYYAGSVVIKQSLYGESFTAQKNQAHALGIN